MQKLIYLQCYFEFFYDENKWKNHLLVLLLLLVEFVFVVDAERTIAAVIKLPPTKYRSKPIKIKMKQHNILWHMLLYKSGPNNCLKKSSGCRILKFKRPAGSGRVGKMFGSALPNPFLRFVSALYFGTNSKESCTLPWDYSCPN